MKIRPSVTIWTVSTIASIASVLLLAASLPERVATHFGTSGQANGWMTHSSHLIFFILFAIGFSSFVIGISYIIRFLPASMLNVPHAEYWRSPEHYRKACDFLFLHSFWFGALSSIWVAALHYLIVQANRTTPAVLDSAKMGGLTLAFLTGTGLWVAAMIWHFAHPPITDVQK